MIIPPIDCRMCKTVNRWHSVDAHFNHIETAFVHPIIVRNDSYKLLTSNIAFACILVCIQEVYYLSISDQCYPRYLSEK